MKYLTTFIIIIIISFIYYSYPQTNNTPHVTKVMTLGVFHFEFPNRDVVKTSDKDKIDVLDAKYQEEIEKLVSELKDFKPTRIFVEAKVEKQNYIDSLFKAYLEGRHSLGRNEVEQLGFRLAKELNINHLNCIDTWGKMYESLDYLMSDTSSKAKKFSKYYFDNPDTIYLNKKDHMAFTGSRGIIKNLIEMNDPSHIRESLGTYLIGHFKYEENKDDYTGADFEAGRWFDRNLRIFRNVQRYITKDTNRILVIFGAGHMNILNYLFECSPEFKLISPEPYLRKANR